MDQTATGGWALVADNDGAAALIGAVLELDPDHSYTRSELADAAGVPLKDLYLSDALDELAAIGLLESVQDAEEATYEIVGDSTVYERAAAFEDAVREQVDPERQSA
ncbi:hypothetical protein [Halapricum salinum]|uniref:ArsR family transcriptional regulator n=1 Tax=Halapricum salinum TaxID=1457250 RepID=A0A4D6H9W1_9EURY|nr:hypothetical protein [Halapricum salinum]QCC49996.1 hypothetical protein DV733_01620 [Halapricum salinum]